MIHLVVALMLAPHSLPEANIRLRDRAMSPTPVTDKDLRPGKLPDCRNDSEVQITLQQIRNGEQELCFIRDMSAFKRPPRT